MARVESTQPNHVQQVLDDARDLLARQLVEDDALFQRAKEILEAVAKTETLDGFRYWSVQGLQRDLPLLRYDLDRFAKARRAHMQEWQDFKAPTPMEAAYAALDAASETATAAFIAASSTATLALGAANEGIDKLGGFFGRAGGRRKLGARMMRPMTNEMLRDLISPESRCQPSHQERSIRAAIDCDPRRRCRQLMRRCPHGE